MAKPLLSENPTGLVSLFDLMHPYQAELFSYLSYLLGQMNQLAKTATGKTGPSKGSVLALSTEIHGALAACSYLGLKLTAIELAQAGTLVANAFNEAIATGTGEGWAFASASVHAAAKRLKDELAAKKIFAVSDGLMGMLHPELFGQDVATRFPSAAIDIKAAGECLACGQNTASVFHLMRVLQFGLDALAKIFEVPFANRTWLPVIEEIESKVREMHKHPKWKALPDVKQQQEFYAQVITPFGVLKDAYRNCTMHGSNGQYGLQEALDIMTSVRVLMQKLTTRFDENGVTIKA